MKKVLDYTRARLYGPAHAGRKEDTMTKRKTAPPWRQLEPVEMPAALLAAIKAAAVAEGLPKAIWVRRVLAKAAGYKFTGAEGPGRRAART